ncbi:MAG: hypothetical protein KJ672_07155 [Candidatus Thermoplasmatota archaeon]|nr:hypothetical protein [Candidatus Thermoplasmatota archaeon]
MARTVDIGGKDSVERVAAALPNAWDIVKYLEKDTCCQCPGKETSGIKAISKTKGDD